MDLLPLNTDPIRHMHRVIRILTPTVLSGPAENWIKCHHFARVLVLPLLDRLLSHLRAGDLEQAFGGVINPLRL